MILSVKAILMSHDLWLRISWIGPTSTGGSVSQGRNSAGYATIVLD